MFAERTCFGAFVSRSKNIGEKNANNAGIVLTISHPCLSVAKQIYCQFKHITDPVSPKTPHLDPRKLHPVPPVMSSFSPNKPFHSFSQPPPCRCTALLAAHLVRSAELASRQAQASGWHDYLGLYERLILHLPLTADVLEFGVLRRSPDFVPVRSTPPADGTPLGRHGPMGNQASRSCFADLEVDEMSP